MKATTEVAHAARTDPLAIAASPLDYSLRSEHIARFLSDSASYLLVIEHGDAPSSVLTKRRFLDAVGMLRIYFPLAAKLAGAEAPAPLVERFVQRVPRRLHPAASLQLARPPGREGANRVADNVTAVDRVPRLMG